MVNQAKRLRLKRVDAFMGTLFLLIVLAGGVVMFSGCRSIRPPRNSRPVVRTMIVTGYCKCGKCCSWKRTWYGRAVIAAGPRAGQRKEVGITASGSRAMPGTIAADTRLYPMGTVMHVEGYGYGRVEDRGGAIKQQHIDLYFRSHREAREWGRKTMRVKVWL
jgi:3D (Asp-Asp-Asp) domain-containing protein